MRKTKRPRSRSRAPEILTRQTYPRYIFVPDTQVRPGVKTDHLLAAGNYIAAKDPDVVVMAGDWWDMASLSSYEDAGSAYWDEPTRTVLDDIEAGNRAMRLFLGPIFKRKRRPRLLFMMGNHENRIARATHASPKLRRLIDKEMLELDHWEVKPFLKVMSLGGILWSHYFVNQQSLKKNVLSGTMDNRLNKIKCSFVMGHQQTRMWGSQWTSDGREIMGLVAGAFYQHDEDYAGPQGNSHWRGICVMNEVHNGAYDLCWVSLNYLRSNWL